MSPFTRFARRLIGSALTLALTLALVWGLAGVGGAGPALAAAANSASQAHPASSVVQQAVQLDSPAVVRIVSVINASLTCAGCASSGGDIHWPSDGSNFTYYSSGTGAFITPTGAILTADHVVDHSMHNPDDVDYVEQQAAPDIGAQYNPSKVTINFQVVFQKAFLSTAYTGNLHDTGHVYAFAITSIAASSPVENADTAIVRIDTSGVSPAPDFPYLTLASAPVSVLDTVTAIAFPSGADGLPLSTADFTSLINYPTSDPNTLSSLLSSSVNSGAITKANEIRPDGTQVYEATSIASNGSSGGPVINDQGQVIGFVDAGTSDNRLTFIIPGAVVKTYAAQAGVASPTGGRFMGLWTQALGAYNSSAACHWTTAESDLATLKKQYPTFGGVTPFLTQAQQGAAGESCGATSSAPGTSTGVVGDMTAGLALIGGCVIAGLALILGVIFLFIALRRRRKRRQPAPVAAPYAAPYPPNYPPAGYPPHYPPAGYAAAPGAAPALYPAGTRHCLNGHAIVEADALFCPVCGAPLDGMTARE